MCIRSLLSLDDYPEFKNKDIIHHGWKIMEDGRFPIYFEYLGLADEDVYNQVEKEKWYEANISEWHEKHLLSSERYLPAFHLFLTKEDAALHWLFRNPINMSIVPILFKEVKAVGWENDRFVVAAKYILFIEE